MATDDISMKPSVMMSIKPKYCELIASSKKTIEVRKSKPKLKTPLKCYIYCTLPKERFSIGQGNYACSDNLYLCDNKVKLGDGFEDFHKETISLNGKVIGEFICDKIQKIEADNLVAIYFNNPANETCITDLEMRRYANGKNLFLWHISNLVIYDEPKELDDFIKRNIPSFENLKEEDLQTLCKNCHRTNFGEQIDCIITQFYNSYECDMGDCEKAYENYIFDNYSLKRPPQSWCYVEV